MSSSLEAMAEAMDTKCMEVFREAIERVKKEIEDEHMDFLFMLLDNPRMLKWFEDDTQTLVHSFVRLTEIRNSLEEVYWEIENKGVNNEERFIDPFSHPEEECVFVATPQDEEVAGEGALEDWGWLPESRNRYP